MLIIKDLGVEDQNYINNILIARPELTKVEIHSVSWEEGDGKRLSGAMATRKFVGPKSYCMAKKKRVLKALGASVNVKNFRIQYSRKRMIFESRATFYADYLASYSTFPRQPLEIGLCYSMPTYCCNGFCW